MADKNRAIRFSEYEAYIRKNMGDNIFTRLEDILDNQLACGTCKQVLPVSEFSRCKTNRNRMGRYAHCKECARNNYQEIRDLTSNT